jgi:hypothetical protein
MPNVRNLQVSFSGGEMSPEMFGRIDDIKVKTGLALCKNFIVKPQGPIENRSGTSFVNEVKNSLKTVRLIPFTFSTTQTMVLEFGDLYIRFHTQGATLQYATPAAYATTHATATIAISKTATVTMTIATPCVVSWAAHTLANGDRVIFTTTGALPSPLVAGTTYYVINQAAGTFQLALTSGGAAISTLGSTQSGTHTAYTPTLVTLTAHGLTANTRVGFTTTGALPTGMAANTPYYVRNPSANAFEISSTSGGNANQTSGTQSGTQTVGNIYLIGELARNGGVNYYCTANAANIAPPSASYWYALPSNLTYEIPTTYAMADLADLHFVQSADIITIVHPNYPPAELRRYGATNWQLIAASFNPTVLAPTGITVTQAGSTATKYTYRYVVTAIADDLISESEKSVEGSVASNLLETGCTVTIAWNPVVGAARYNVYKLQGGIYGYIGATTTLSIIDDNISPDMSVTPPIVNNDFVSAGNYPGAVSYYEQRRCFAGTTNDPQKIWMTRSGTESNMSYSLPTRDDDRIEFRVAAREANTIRHIVPLTQLVLLTSSAEWRITSVNSDALTPSSISVRPQSYVGANNVQPVIINNTMLYGAARGGHVRELGYSWQSQGFITNDLCLRSAHLFDNENIVDMAYSKAPQPLIWMVSSSGKLLGLTYVPEQQIAAWHQHETDGAYESCTVVAEGDEDVLYVVVKRTINGVTKRYIERLESRHYDDPVDAFFVDSGLTYDGRNTSATTMTISGGTTWIPSQTLTVTSSTPQFVYPGTTDVGDVIQITDTDGTEYRFTVATTTSTTVATGRFDKTIPVSLRNSARTNWSFDRFIISGLSHLEGKVVNILADAAVHPQRTVVGGSITLDRPVSVANIGLPIVADAQTMPASMQIDNGMAQGRYKNINKAWLRVFQSSGVFIGPDANNLKESKQRTTEPYGSPPALKSQEIMVMTTPSWTDNGQVYIRQVDPLPLTVVGLTLEVAIGG